MASSNGKPGIAPSRECLMNSYSEALQAYVAGEGHAALHRAEELARCAVAAGLSVAEIAAAHQREVAPLVLRAVLEEDTEGAKEAVEMFCASCPAGCVSKQDLPGTAAAREQFFAETLFALTISHRALQKANAGLRHLSEVHEEEARRIAHALHDQAAQILGSVHLRIENVAHDLAPLQRQRLQGVREHLYEIEEQLRQVAHELRPTILDDLGLMPALEFLAQGIGKRTGISIHVGGAAAPRLPASRETALYRIVQEALTNVIRHSLATHASVQVSWNGWDVSCTIRDNGVGFDPDTVLAKTGERGLGLIGIQGRVDMLGGTLQIQSATGQGAELNVKIPLEAAA